VCPHERLTCVRPHAMSSNTADYSPVKRKNAHAIRSSVAICIPDGAILEFRIVVRPVLSVV
jgi:hypothetical protein